jgi:hypothetical protein
VDGLQGAKRQPPAKTSWASVGVLSTSNSSPSQAIDVHLSFIQGERRYPRLVRLPWDDVVIHRDEWKLTATSPWRLLATQGQSLSQGSQHHITQAVQGSQGFDLQDPFVETRDKGRL